MRLTAITLPWADGEFIFDLKLGQVRALQDKCGAGPGVILLRLQSGEYRVDDFRETILQGLLGGGMNVDEARKLVHLWVDERPAQESLLPARAILMAWIMGAPQETESVPTSKKKRRRKTETAPAGSTLPNSTEQALQ